MQDAPWSVPRPRLARQCVFKRGFWRLVATAIVQPGYRAAQLDAAADTRNLSPFVMLYRVYEADEFYKLMGLFRKELAQADGTFRVVTMIPHTFFVNWYALLPYITFVVH